MGGEEILPTSSSSASPAFSSEATSLRFGSGGPETHNSCKPVALLSSGLVSYSFTECAATRLLPSATEYRILPREEGKESVSSLRSDLSESRPTSTRLVVIVPSLPVSSHISLISRCESSSSLLSRFGYLALFGFSIYLFYRFFLALLRCLLSQRRRLAPAGPSRILSLANFGGRWRSSRIWRYLLLARPRRFKQPRQ